MNSNSLATFLSRRGQIVSVAWARQMAVPKGATVSVEKHVSTQARAGVNYDNISKVQDKRESGELPAQNAGLPWGHWHTVAGVSLFPHVIAHTPKGQSVEKHYLRFATLAGVRAVTRYYANGQEISEARARELTLAKEWRDESGPLDVYTVAAENVISIS